MKILAIETSCDETAVSVIEGTGEKISVLSNVISSQIKLHAKYGGVVPMLAAREHVKNIRHVFESALREAGIDPLTDAFEKEIDLMAVTRGPGLGPALLVGLTFAKTLSWTYKKPLVGVNHMDGHIHSNWLKPIVNTKSGKSEVKIRRTPADFKKSEIFPALNLLVSGGHTELVLMKDHGEYEIIGETLDDAIGEAFDKSARLLGLGYPGGPAISKLAEHGNPEVYPLPQPMLNSKNFDFSYSGLKTAVLYLIRDLTNKGARELSVQEKKDIAASFQKSATDVLVSKTARAVAKYKAKSILLAGGVSANKILRQKLQVLAAELNIKYFCPDMQYTTDNASMIAAAGYFAFLKKKKLPSFKAAARQRKTASYETVFMDANLSL